MIKLLERRTVLTIAVSLLLVATQGAGRHAVGEILSDGTDTDKQPAVFSGPASGPVSCSILFFRGLQGNVDETIRLEDLGYDVTPSHDRDDLTVESLSRFDALVINLAAPGTIGGFQSDIESFVLDGGGLLIHQPGYPGLTDYAPTDFEVDIESTYWCHFPATPFVCLVDNTHPIVFGLTNDDMSGAADLVDSIGPGYTVLAESCVCGDPALAAGTLGEGRVAFDTGNFDIAGPGISLLPGSDEYILSLFNWLCGAPEPVPSTSTVGLVLLLLVMTTTATILILRRRSSRR